MIQLNNAVERYNKIILKELKEADITDRKILHSMSTTKMSERIKIALTKLKK